MDHRTHRSLMGKDYLVSFGCSKIKNKEGFKESSPYNENR